MPSQICNTSIESSDAQCVQIVTVVEKAPKTEQASQLKNEQIQETTPTLTLTKTPEQALEAVVKTLGGGGGGFTYSSMPHISF